MTVRPFLLFVVRALKLCAYMCSCLVCALVLSDPISFLICATLYVAPVTETVSHGSGGILTTTCDSSLWRCRSLLSSSLRSSQVTMVQQVANTSLDPPGLGSGRCGRTIDAKCFRAIAFGCDAREWGAWSFAFKRTVRSCSRDGFIMMDFVEKQNAEVQEHLLGGKGTGSVSPNVVSKLWAELHDVLRQVVPGEAMTILRSVEDCRGFVAWQNLYQKFNPKTVARAIRSLAEACSPAKDRSSLMSTPRFAFGSRRWLYCPKNSKNRFPTT